MLSFQGPGLLFYGLCWIKNVGAPFPGSCKVAFTSWNFPSDRSIVREPPKFATSWSEVRGALGIPGLQGCEMRAVLWGTVPFTFEVGRHLRQPVSGLQGNGFPVSTATCTPDLLSLTSKLSDSIVVTILRGNLFCITTSV